MNKIIKIFGLLTILIMVCSPLTSANTTISGTDRSIGAVAQTIPDSVVDPNNNNTVANFIKSKYPNINKVEISLILGFMSKSQQQGFDIFAGYISGDPTYVNYYNSGSPYTTAVINNWFEWIDEYSKLDFIGRANYLNYNMPSDDLTSDILDNASEDEVIYIIERTQSYLTNITSVSSTLSDDLDHTSNLFTKGNIGKEGSVKVQEAITNYNRGVSIAHLAYQIEHSDDEPLSIEKILNSDLTIPEQIATLIGYRDLANNSLTRIDKTITTISSAITGVSVAGGIIFAGAMLILIFGAAAGPAYIALIPLGLVILAIGLVLIGCDCGLETAKNRLNNVKHQTQDFIDTLTPIINTLSASVLDWKKYSNLSIDNVTLSSPHKEVFVGDSVNVSFHVVNSDMNNSSISDGRYNVSVGGSDLSLDFVDGWANYLYKVNQPTNNLAIVFKENLEANDTQSVYLSVNKTVSNVNWIDRPFKNTQLNILNGDNISLDDNGGVLLRFNVSTVDGKSVRDGVYRVDVFYFVDSSSSSISYFDVSFRDGVGECYYVPNVGVDVRLMITFERVPKIYGSSSVEVPLNLPSFLNFVNGYSFGGWGSKLSKKNMFL